MALEIERKFVVTDKRFIELAKWNKSIMQAYLSITAYNTIRIRISGDKAWFGLKARVGQEGYMVRKEFEYEIPLAEANELLEDLCQKPLLEKTRYQVPSDNVVFEVDEFHGENKGLIIAEVELENEQQKIPKPDWLGEEVTGDPRYYNSNLIANPYRNFRS